MQHRWSQTYMWELCFTDMENAFKIASFPREGWIGLVLFSYYLSGCATVASYESERSYIEKYLEINIFEVRQILCRFRISSHHLRVETERDKNNSLERSQRICKFCSQNDIEDKPHFLIKCAFYNSLREELYTKIQNYC